MNSSWHTWPFLVLLGAAVTVTIACAEPEDGEDDDAGVGSTTDDPGPSSNASATSTTTSPDPDSTTTSPGTDPTAPPETGEGRECEPICSGLAANPECSAVGFEEGLCLSACTGSGQACATCLGATEQCGDDCFSVCGGSATTTEPDPDSGDTSAPSPDCRSDDECGLARVCTVCNLNDTEGWCQLQAACNFDEDCRVGERCGWFVAGGGFNCISAEICGD